VPFVQVSDPSGEFPVTFRQVSGGEDNRDGSDSVFGLRDASLCPRFLLNSREMLIRTAQGLSVLRKCKPSHPLSAAVYHPIVRLCVSEGGARVACGMHEAWHRAVESAIRSMRVREEREREQKRKEAVGHQRSCRAFSRKCMCILHCGHLALDALHLAPDILLLPPSNQRPNTKYRYMTLHRGQHKLSLVLDLN